MEYFLTEPSKPIFFKADGKFLVSFKVLSIEPIEVASFTLILTTYPNNLRSKNNFESKALHFFNLDGENLKTLKLEGNVVEYSIHLQPSSSSVSVKVDITSSFSV